MPEDVLEKLSTVIGRKVTGAPAPAKPVATTDKSATAQPNPSQSLEKLIGRPLQATTLSPMAQQRLRLYGDAKKNGFDSSRAAKVAVDSAGVVSSTPTAGWWEKTKKAAENLPVAPGSNRTFGDVGSDIGEIAHRVWANPMAVPDEQWEKDKTAMNAYITEANEKHLGTSRGAKFFAGAQRGAAEFVGQQMAPGQIALLVGTFGESALVRAAGKIGIEGAVPAAKTLSKLIQAQFVAQMAEGTATGIENTFKSAMNGDWGAAGEAAIGALVSGVMAKGLVAHEAANSKVRGDLERTARDKYGAPAGNPVQASITSRFDQLDVHQQAAVIDSTVRGTPEYQAIIADSDEKTKKQNAKRLSSYYEIATSQAWDPDVAKRTMRKLQTGRERGAAMDAQQAEGRARDQKIGEWLQGAREEYEKQRTEARSARPQRKQEEAAERSQVGRVAEGVAQKRDELWQQRNEAQTAEAGADVPPRDLEIVTDAQGNVMYPATYWGEQNHFGAVADSGGHAIYRQTERGTEWLDANGKFTDSPDALYMTPDPATADAIARISAVNAEVGSIADQEEATPDQKTEAEKVAAIHRGLVAGEITGREAKQQAGIAEKVTLPGEFEAARDGRLNGPFHESSAADYSRGLEEEARSIGASDEEVNAILDEAGLLARQSTESNLHHVYRPGDYITGKNGVKWTLDSKGMLYPDDGGQAVPLMRRGLYSNDAMQLAQSGRVGYGLKTREERRADTARQRATAADIAANQAVVDHEMRLAVQRQGIQPALEVDPRVDAEEKAVREQRRMSRPPRPESSVDKVVRMVFQKPTDPNSVIASIANRRGVTPEEVMRLALANDPERARSTESQIARLEVGDQVSDSFRKDKPWKVELRKDGSLALRSGNASPIPLDRLNPSDRVKQLVEKGTITSEKPEFTEDDTRRAAFDKPHYFRHQEELVQQVVDRKEGKAKDPEPRTEKQAKAQAKAAERRAVAAEAVATRAVVEAVNPVTESVEQAEGKVDDAERQIAVAEEAVAQQVEAETKTEPKGDFPQRAPVSVGYRAPKAGTIKQNGRQFSFHYELLPLDAVVTSHQWINGRMEINPDFPEALQPRTVSSDESKLNALRAERRVETPDGRSSGYDFSEYADMTINGSMGPAIVDQGGQTVGGNTRIAIMRRHLDTLAAIGDPDEREAYQMGMKSAMRKLAEDVGIPGYPEGDIPHVVVRMLDDPIVDSRKAAELGRLFNKKVGVQIGEAARGVSFAKSLDDSLLQDIGRRVEANDGIAGAIASDPEFFTNIVRNRFDVDETEDADWFRKTDQGTKVLHEKGRDQFTKALLGTVVKDTSVLNRLEGKTPYRALERALGYIVKMKALPDRDLTPKIMEALQAAAETSTTDPALSRSNDKWLATYHPDQLDLIASESTTPPEPDRVVETLWRALHSSDAATPRVFNDRLKAFLGEDSSLAGNMFEVTRPTMAEAFNDAFSKQLGEVQYSRQDSAKGVSDDEFEHSLRNEEMSEVEREEAQNSERKGDRGESPEQQAGSGLASIPATNTPDTPVDVVKPETKKMERPPKAEPKPERVLAAAKAEKGYVTPSELKSFLEGHPGTKDSVPELMRTSRIMAEFVFDADQPVGVDRKDALAWILKERLAGVEDGNLKTKRGEYSDPNIEKGFGDRIMKLHKAADASSFIHEFAHVIFPMLSDQDLQLIDTIRGEGEKGEAGRVWDRKTRLEGDPYRKLSEKFAHGLEQFLRDENPTGFTSEVKAVLAKVKDMMQRIYAKFAGDPLSPFANTEESRDVFSRMFGITDFDAQDRWSKEKARIRAEEAKMKKPSEALHPIQQMAREAGAKSLQAAMSGKVEDQIGARIDPRKPTAVMIFDDETKATEFAVDVASGGRKIDGAEVVRADDGKWGVRFNTSTKLPTSVLYQDIPKTELALDLERAKKALAETPESAGMLRKMRQQRVQILENQVREHYGAEPEPVDAPVAKQALQEVKNGGADGLRKVADGVSRVPDAPRFAGVPKPPTGGRTARDASAGQRGVGATGKPAAEPRSLADVKAVALQPLTRERGPAAGTVVGEAHDSKAWVASLKKAGLPEGLPAPTWALDRKTADMLIFPGQKQVVQVALSALEQGDGAVVATATGTGKTHTASAIIKEWRLRHPEAKVIYITKNNGLLKSTGNVMESTFGYDMESDVPDAPQAGVYGATYAKLLSNENLKNIKWDMVIADESGEARNYYRDENKQGKALVELTANAGKTVWFSATPFHSPAEYGYLNKLNLWPKNGFDKWIEGNFAHEKVDGKVIAKLDPAKQAKLRQQLIERGQLVSQAVSYDGFTAHFGVVPVTDQMIRDIDRTKEGFARARKYLSDKGKKGLAEKSAALEATYTKALLERARLPQAIELGKRARANGWQVLYFSETSSEDLFRRDTTDPGTYQQLDEAMGGQLSKIIPAFPNVYDKLSEEFGDAIGDYSGMGNSMADRERAKGDFLSGKNPMLYTTYAAGGIGVSLHDADYPERGIKGGDKPRIAIFLGPPYSGVMLEQALGRTWRFGVKSDSHAVFLATDSEPDIRLMQQKVGPRMRALRASVLGERDSLASAMADYTDEEKVKARQEALAYSEAGDEVKLNAASFQVRNAKRNVGINDWSLINFPSAESAKNKGMKYGEDVPGGDWSTLYQEKFGFMEAPPSPADTAANAVIDAIGAGISSGDGLPKGVSIQDMEPADRDTVLGSASASASEAVKQPVERDKSAAARQTIQAHLAMPGDKTKWVLTFPKKGKGVWRYTGDPEDIARSKPAEGGEGQRNKKTRYFGMYFSQEVGINSIARQAGAREAGEAINRINRSYQADSDVKFADFALDAQRIMERHNLDVNDPQVMSELYDTVKGTRTTSNPAMQRGADELADLHERVHSEEAAADVKLKTPDGSIISWKEITKDRSYMPQRIDWDAQVEDPVTGEVHKLHDLMGETIPEEKRRRMVDAIAKDKGYTYDQVMDYLKAYQPNTPVLGHINRARTLDFPFVKKDWKTLIGYYRQAADAIAIEKNFGHDRSKLDKEISKIPSINGRKTITNMFDAMLQPQEWDDWTAKAFNAAVAYESASKLTMSASKVIFHAVHFPVGLKGRVRPVMRAAFNIIAHPKEVFENASYVGTIARQLNVADVLAGDDGQGVTHQIFSKTGFNSAYKLVRAWSGESARVWMEQYAMQELQKGNKEEARRLLKNVMLIGDQAIDRAIEQKKFAPEDLAKGQTAFANLTAWSNNPLQMPGWARMHMEKDSATTAIALSRAVRLTYALQSFSLKTASFLRENLWDEVMIHGNYKPLAYAMVAAPIVGQMLQATSAGSRGFVHRGLEGVTGHKHEHDAWDKWLDEQEHTFRDPSAAKFLKYYIDSVTLGYGLDMARVVMDPMLNALSGNRKLGLKEAKYVGEDVITHMVGPAYSDLYKTIVDLPTKMFEIEAASQSEEVKAKKALKTAKGYLMDEIPILRSIPGMAEPPKRSN